MSTAVVFITSCARCCADTGWFVKSTASMKICSQASILFDIIGFDGEAGFERMILFQRGRLFQFPSRAEYAMKQAKVLCRKRV